MKVLIMEDETQTREGIAASLPWQECGVSEVYTAKNGKIGYELARKHRPDIILTDIRMPRMDGIAAVKRLRGILPECSIIFISAYPEKQYFKEAIRLKAVSFVEKPVDMVELKAVLQEAVREQRRGRHRQRQEEKALRYSVQQLVTRLNRNEFKNRDECRAELAAVGVSAEDYRSFATILVRYFWGRDPEDETRWNDFCERPGKYAEGAPARILAAQKQPELCVFHLFMKQEREFSAVLSWLRGMLAGVKRFYILAGSIQHSYMKLHDSYNDAAVQMNRAFYLPYGSVAHGSGDVFVTLDMDTWRANFTEKLRMGRIEELPALLEEYRQQIAENKRIHYTVIREFYLYLYGELSRYVEQNALFVPGNTVGYTREVLKNGNYQELHEGLLSAVHKIQNASETGENELIVRIKKYIGSNYQNAWLSIGEISGAMGMSVSYICVIFKKETGETLNQYLTEVRMEAARVMLDNPRNTVKTVSEACGYTDSSYFTRAFKKYTGQTPSEYRGDEK